MKASRLVLAGVLLAAALLPVSAAAPREELPVDPSRWRGFNLLE